MQKYWGNSSNITIVVSFTMPKYNLGAILAFSHPLMPSKCKMHFNIFYKLGMAANRSDSASCIIPDPIL
jgi:hypothetical protein